MVGTHIVRRTLGIGSMVLALAAVGSAAKHRILSGFCIGN